MPTHTILILAPQPFYEDRGTPITTRFVIDALTEANHKVDLLTFPIGQDIQKNGLTIYRTLGIPGVQSIPIGFSIRKLSFNLFLFFTMWRKILTNQYDCIIAVEESAFLALSAKAFTRLPLIYDMQSCLPEHLTESHALFRLKPVKVICKFFEKQLLKRSDTVICSKGLAHYVNRRAPETPVHEWIYPGSSTEISNSFMEQLIQKLSIDEDSPIIIYTGNSETYQGIDLLIKSAELVLTKSPNNTFLLVGVEENTVRAMASENILKLIDQDKIKCIPRQGYENVSALLSIAHIAISPRKDHGNLPLKIFNYLQHGLPMIVTDIHTHRQLLDESLARFVKSNPADMAAGIIHLLTDEQHTEQLRENSLEYAEKNLTVESFQDRLTEIVQTTINGRKRQNL